MSRRDRTPALLFAAALAAAAGACSRKEPVAPVPPAPLSVVAVQPPARSAGYAYDGQIWALFDRPLDPKTVDSTSVFLKIDTKRLSCAIGYEPTSRRIVVVPRAALALNTTFTVIVTTRVKAKDGASLPQEYLWQFSTSSIRRLEYVDPAPGVVATPVAMLRWSSPGAVPGALLFQVYAGPDSGVVANRLIAPVLTTVRSYYLPRQEWPEGARTYWAVTTTNLTTGEKLLSPTAGFEVLPAGAPTHVVTTGLIEWGAVQNNRTTQYCLQTYIPVGASYNSAVRVDLDPSRLGKRVRSARLTMVAIQGSGSIPLAKAWACGPTWYACAMAISGPPSPDEPTPLATAHVGSTSTELVFDSVGLAAWAEGMLRGGDFSGLVLGAATGSTLYLNMRGSGVASPLLTLTVYD